MKRAFTTREKVLIIIFAVIIIGICYFKLLLEPVNESISQYQTDMQTEQDEILLNQAKLAKMNQMQDELDEIYAEGDAKPLPSYDNSDAMLTELNSILSASNDYSLSFGTVSPLEQTQYIMNRPVTMHFYAKDYKTARGILDKLHDSDNINQLSDLTITFNDDSSVNVSADISYFELSDN